MPDPLFPQLSYKQERFCQEYIKDLNGTQAALRAGHSAKGASIASVRHLKVPVVQQYIAHLQQQYAKKIEITTEAILQEFAKIGLANIQNYITNGNHTKDLTEIPPEHAACVASIKVTEVISSNNTRITTEMKLHDKISALEKLGRHLGLFSEKSEPAKTPLSERATVQLSNGTTIEI